MLCRGGVVAAPWQIAPWIGRTPTSGGVGLCKWMPGEGGSSGIPLWSTSFWISVGISLCIPVLQRSCYSSFKFLSSPVLSILIVSPVLRGRRAQAGSCGVFLGVCWGRESVHEQSWTASASAAGWESCGPLCSPRGWAVQQKAFCRGSLTKKMQRSVCPRHYVWNPQGSIWNSGSPPVPTNILPEAWLKTIHMPAFWPRPKCFKIIYVPITLHYFLTKDLISLQRRTQYKLAQFSAATENLHLGDIFQERHGT